MKEQELEQLKAYLLALQQGTLSPSEQSALVHFSVSLFLAHLHSHRVSYAHLCEKAGISEQELAYDCIADFFARNSRNEFIRINHCLANLPAQVEHTSAKEIFLHYKSFLLRCADIHLARLYALYDNAGAHIKKNITETIKRTNHFTAVREYSGMILHPSGADPLRHLEVFPVEQLQQQFLISLDGKRTTEHLLQKLFTILTQQNMYSRALPLNTVVQIMKKGFPAEVEMLPEKSEDENGGNVFPAVSDYTTEFELEAALRKTLNLLKEKIFTKYLLTGKLTKNEAEGLFCALRDWLEDAKSSQEVLPMKEYCTTYIPMNDETYYARIAKKMDYLQKLMRRELQSYFDEEV
ncbi:MAG: hypothetical protein FJ218_07150 [Ignavibacteria bacterium]|nr:hypothetical protein [Ignavibacteria bacterium]